MKNYTDIDVVISSRIRFARNIADYPFMSKCDPTSAGEIIEKVRNALGDGFKELDFSTIDEIKAGSYVEDHSVSRDFVKSPLPHSLFCDIDILPVHIVCVKIARAAQYLVLQPDKTAEKEKKRCSRHVCLRRKRRNMG